MKEENMTTPGFAGKILRVNLTAKQISSIETSQYEAYGGGLGSAIAIFWDLCVAPGGWDLQDAFDPRNIVTLMTGALAGTGLPYTSRTSVSGLAPQPWPVNWFSRSNFGGSFAPMLKFAGWDGVIVEGKSDVPVYINIVDDKVILEDAKSWGAGLIVLGSHGRHGLERILLGSVAEAVAAHAHCSVQVVR